MDNPTGSPLGSPIFQSKLSPGAAKTQFLSNQMVVPDDFTAYSLTQPYLQNDFSLDPNNPFFYLFALGAMTLGTVGGQVFHVAGKSIFTFTNGGSQVSDATIYFGDGAALDDPDNVPAMVATASLGIPVLYAHDPVSGTCPGAGFSSDATGIISKWSSLADKVNVKTYLLGARGDGSSAGAGNGFTLMHGIIQQPWG